LSSLEELNLGYNNLDILPSSLGALSKLKKLDLSNNKLNNIPEYISKLESLETLLIDGNKLDHIPDDLQVNHLQIDHKQSIEFKTVFQKLKKKVKIRILNNTN